MTVDQCKSPTPFSTTGVWGPIGSVGEGGTNRVYWWRGLTCNVGGRETIFKKYI